MLWMSLCLVRNVVRNVNRRGILNRYVVFRIPSSSLSSREYTRVERRLSQSKINELYPLTKPNKRRDGDVGSTKDIN